jgi:NAD(P)-dependent dehydrogenase (short-subunit alcohol dehydrogenase family)
MKGKTAIVTGGASGMGEAVVRQLLDKGANILAVDRDPRALERLVARSGCDRLIPVEADIALEATAAALVETCRGKFGNVRFLVNCAGITRMPVPFEATQLSDFELVGAVNLRGTFLTMRAVIPHMKESGGGSIVNISSTAGIRPLTQATAYTASKWGVIGISLTAALETAAAGIRVNVVCPGITDTPMLHGMAGDHTTELAAGTPMRRIGKPEEIANAVTWLLSDAASFVTGVVMPVDGGLALV